MAFPSLEAFFVKYPVSLKSRIRFFFYKLFGMQIGSGNRFEKGLFRRAIQIQIGNNNAFTEGYKLWPADEFHSKKRIIIGNGNYFNRGLILDACGTITIGNKNMFGPDIFITDSNHTYGPGLSPTDTPMQVGSVIIGDNCWIGAKVVILKDVILGDNCVVAAGAVVTKSFPAGSIIGGVPAKLIKNIFTIEKVKE
ncbi:acetyltransferase-like isoleucine patch superfamily enzyme [Chitinophagaceae bacterium OAS944]